MKARKQAEGIISLYMSPEEKHVIQHYNRIDLNREMIFRLINTLTGETGKEIIINAEYAGTKLNPKDYFQTG